MISAVLTHATPPVLIISVVSHNQGLLVSRLLADLERYCVSSGVSVVLTLNVPEQLPFTERDFGIPIVVKHNDTPKGFGANHNAAFREAQGDFFCIVNPDIRLKADPFPPLLGAFTDERIGISAPIVVDPEDRIEDSVRVVPTPLFIIRKLLGRVPPDYDVNGETLYPEWIGGMFMVFRSRVFAQLGGFDERYFLYYEDVDLCCRARLAGFDIAVAPEARVIHEARRDSRRRPKYLMWHLFSMLRFFTSPVFFSTLRRRKAVRVP